MSERGQKIFKIVVWIVLVALIVFQSIRVGLRIVNEGDEEYSASRREDMLAATPIVGLTDSVMGELFSDADGVMLGDQNEVCFYVSANPKRSKVYLYSEDEKIGEMKDDGENGDEKAEDGIYSLVVEVTGEPGSVKSYHVKIDKEESNSVEVRIFDELKEEDFAEMQATVDSIIDIESKYEVDGYIPDELRDEFIEEIYNAAIAFSEENNIKILTIEKTNDGVYILFESGIQYIYTIKSQDSEAGDEEVYLSVRTLEPYLSTSSGSSQSLASFADSANLIDETLDGAAYDMVFNDEDVTFDNIKKAFQPDSFIIWHGHGGYSDRTGSFLATGQEATLLSQTAHSIDMLAGRVVVTGGGRFAITYKYFNKYVKNLEDSFVYLGGCHTGQDRKLMSVMMWKDADVVVGFSDSVLSVYDCNVMKTMTEKLCSIDPETEQYYTISRALYMCTLLYGTDDGDDTPAELMYMGNEDYRIDLLIPAQWNPDIDIETPDLDKVGNDAKKDLDKKIDDKINKIADSLLKKIEDAINKWLDAACSGC